ncbi:ABC transporter permease [Paenibacillus tundrae]|uniref:ABC transporter permease n=1 Tax=Paenibacillus tundrae TaxID=528187 RepID=UPI0030CCC56A
MNVSSRRKITRILRSELDKLVTLPWIWINVLSTFIANLFLAAAYTSASTGLHGTVGIQNELDIGLASMVYLQAGFIILGILATCTEYTGGQMRTTLTVVPWRGLQLCMKHVALAIITIPAAFVIVLSGVLYPLIMLRDTAAVVELDIIIGTLVGATGYLTLITLLSAAVGAILRRTTSALVVLLTYYFILSPLSRDFLPRIRDYFPDTAGLYMYIPPSSDVINGFTPIQGTGISMLWTLTLIIVATICHCKRDV